MSIENALKSATKSVTKKWTKQRKKEEKGASQYSRMYIYSDRVNFTEIADGILPAAYEHASGGGEYPVSKRQLFYASREKFLAKTGRPIEYKYFANTLLVQYMNRNDLDWRITADPRGTLTIPNAASEQRIPVGTLQIDDHLQENDWSEFDETSGLDKRVSMQWPSLAAGHRYQGVLYIEKEGFDPIMQEARIAERFDIAIISSKGQSVVAARKYIDMVCGDGEGVPLFVVHDFDKAGFEIAQRLTQVSDWATANDRVTYEFENEINATDLGLRLADVKHYGLPDEQCKFNGRFARDSICTQEEKDFLKSDRRVELNAMTSPQFIEWLEDKLTVHLPDRLIPQDDILEKAYCRALAAAQINQAIARELASAEQNAADAEIPNSLRDQLEVTMAESDRSWDEALFELAKNKLYSDNEK